MQRMEEWSCSVKFAGILHLVSTMEFMHVKVARYALSCKNSNGVIIRFIVVPLIHMLIHFLSGFLPPQHPAEHQLQDVCEERELSDHAHEPKPVPALSFQEVPLRWHVKRW